MTIWVNTDTNVVGEDTRWVAQTDGLHGIARTAWGAVAAVVRLYLEVPVEFHEEPDDG